MQPVTISACLRFGWNAFTARPGILIGVPFLVFLAVIAAAMAAYLGIGLVSLAIGFGVAAAINPGAGIATGIVIAGILSFVFRVAIQILSMNSVMAFYLKAHDDIQHVGINDLWYLKAFWRMLGTVILVTLIVLVGLILLIIPGIILALGLSMASYLVIDQGRGPVSALKESWRITKGHKAKLLLLGIVLMLMNFVGLLLLFVGLFVTIPVSVLAVIHYYRSITGNVLPEVIVAEPIA